MSMYCVKDVMLSIVVGIVFTYMPMYSSDACDTLMLADTLDPIPDFYTSSMCEVVCKRARCGVQYTSLDEVYYFINDDRIHLSCSAFSLEDCGNSFVCRRVAMLAWRHQKPVNSVQFWDDSSGYTTALMLVFAENEWGLKHWSLMELLYYPLDSVVQWGLKNGVIDGAKGRLYTFKNFDTIPTNDEIYAELDRWKIAFDGGFIDFDSTTGIHEWNGLEGYQDPKVIPYHRKKIAFEFIDGDVREKTWEAVIGEKPTKFFPNGK